MDMQDDLDGVNELFVQTEGRNPACCGESLYWAVQQGLLEPYKYHAYFLMGIVTGEWAAKIEFLGNGMARVN